MRRIRKSYHHFKINLPWSLCTFVSIKEMYQKNIAHRDLKPENIARVDKTGTWKIIDFGFSKSLKIKD